MTFKGLSASGKHRGSIGASVSIEDLNDEDARELFVNTAFDATLAVRTSDAKDMEGQQSLDDDMEPEEISFKGHSVDIKRGEKGFGLSLKFDKNEVELDQLKLLTGKDGYIWISLIEPN